MTENPNGKKGYSGKIPVAAIGNLDGELTGLADGTANLTLHIRDGHLARYTTEGEGSYTEGGYSGKTPVAAVIALEWQAAGMAHGTATLALHVKDGELEYATEWECSFIPEGGDGE
jgi:hypothetical protein